MKLPIFRLYLGHIHPSLLFATLSNTHCYVFQNLCLPFQFLFIPFKNDLFFRSSFHMYNTFCHNLIAAESHSKFHVLLIPISASGKDSCVFKWK